ncbi:MAG: archease [Gammaproteobacteria bacterium RIFCSPHIGHO2_12_FULL_43_28]|nr:MAG: archease [Gammaproteobacteria bacterium RIFCSPHIGHO2_12_FULL_43_28]
MQPLAGSENYFEHDADIGIIGRGENLEVCFADAAKAVFSLMVNLSSVRPREIVTFEFEEADVELALVIWLNLLIAKAAEHHMVFCDFRLHRKGALWKAIVSGEKWQANMDRGIEVKGATLTMLSVKNDHHRWEARCVVDV